MQFHPRITYTARCYADVANWRSWQRAGYDIPGLLNNIRLNLQDRRAGHTSPCTNVRFGERSPQDARVTIGLITADVLCFTMQFTPSAEFLTSQLEAQILASLNYDIDASRFSERANRFTAHARTVLGWVGPTAVIDDGDVRQASLDTAGLQTAADSVGVYQVASGLNQVNSTDPARNGNSVAGNALRDAPSIVGDAAPWVVPMLGVLLGVVALAVFVKVS